MTTGLSRDEGSGHQTAYLSIHDDLTRILSLLRLLVYGLSCDRVCLTPKVLLDKTVGQGFGERVRLHAEL